MFKKLTHLRKPQENKHSILLKKCISRTELNLCGF